MSDELIFIEKNENKDVNRIILESEEQLKSLEEQFDSNRWQPYNSKSCQQLCWDCRNGYPSKCSKIADLRKGSIDSYDFITSGYQVVKDGKLHKFVVSSCKNFQRIVERTIKEQRIAKSQVREGMNNILTYYYDTETPEEALMEQQARIARKKTKTL